MALHCMCSRVRACLHILITHTHIEKEREVVASTTSLSSHMHACMCVCVRAGVCESLSHFSYSIWVVSCALHEMPWMVVTVWPPFGHHIFSHTLFRNSVFRISNGNVPMSMSTRTLPGRAVGNSGTISTPGQQRINRFVPNDHHLPAKCPIDAYTVMWTRHSRCNYVSVFQVCMFSVSCTSVLSNGDEQEKRQEEKKKKTTAVVDRRCLHILLFDIVLRESSASVKLFAARFKMVIHIAPQLIGHAYSNV